MTSGSQWIFGSRCQGKKEHFRFNEDNCRRMQCSIPESGAARFNMPISFVVLLSKTVDGRLNRVMVYREKCNCERSIDD